jgi:uncharacterized protein (DUF305 family)
MAHQEIPMRSRIVVAVAALALLGAGFALGRMSDAQPSTGGMMQGQMPMHHGQTLPMQPHGGAHGAAPHTTPGQAVAETPAVAAFREANMRMHAAMDIAYTGDPDRDFALAMIPHHQGAIDMARVVLEFGKDPEIRKLAEEIAEAQEGEIGLLQAWLARHP